MRDGSQEPAEIADGRSSIYAEDSRRPYDGTLDWG